MRIRTAILCAATALLCGCRGVSTAAPSPTKRYEVGAARREQFIAEVPRVLGRLHFELQRTDESDRNARWTTHIKRRPVLDDETDVREAEISLVVSARQARYAMRGDIFNMEVEVESRVRVHPDSGWVAARSTPMYNRYLDRMLQEFRTTFDTGDHLLR
ncbi:hypothetical protein [Longimicrobium terrae]|uniref:DUF4468 domain-containing protein n=1 Tax=Longimicrobium terrae TaxID=1639882 RepID=A0A841GWU6_9BACT|nr:hypothetical protein [Longimicrobium terrae]MBB4634184.1 hypothetical protein [Longimicrobium terrae]MBB6068926.1 hypothetical protein [Longimicrobium terrae]NNC28106.1 hypothetical protein [Longimicrobium terrae]